MVRSLHLAFLLLIVGCLGTSPTLELEDPGSVESVEVKFGSHCRRLDEPRRIEPLVSFLDEHRSGWEPFWGDPEEPSVEAHFLAAGTLVATLGLERGQLFSRVGERAVFKPIASGEASRLLELLGGPPTAREETPCTSFQEPGKPEVR